MKMPLKKREPECGRIEKIRHAVQSRAADAGHRVRDEIGERAPTFDQVKATVAGNAPKVRATMTDAAHTAAEAAQTAAQQAAIAASAAAHTAAERSRPLRAEAASRSTAAWSVLMHGPAPASNGRLHKAMAFGAVSAPAAAGKVGTVVKKKGNSAVGMMAAGGVGAMAILWYRRSRANAEAAWITDADADADPEAAHAASSGGWHERSSVSASARSTGRMDKPSECADPETCRDPAHTWP